MEHRRRKVGEDEWRQLSNLTLWVASPELLEALKAAGWTPPAASTAAKGRATPRAPQNQPRPPKDSGAGARFHEIDQARSQARAAELAGLPSPTDTDPTPTMRSTVTVVVPRPRTGWSKQRPACVALVANEPAPSVGGG